MTDGIIISCSKLIDQYGFDFIVFGLVIVVALYAVGVLLRMIADDFVVIDNASNHSVARACYDITKVFGSLLIGCSVFLGASIVACMVIVGWINVFGALL